MTTPKPYMSFHLLCTPCGRTANDMTCIKRYGARALQSAYHVSTFRDGICSCCGEQTRVTEARDFFYPDERALKLLRQYITKGK